MKMRFFGKALLAAAAMSAALACQPVQAQSWTGFYVGGASGARWSDVKATSTAAAYNFLPNIVQDNFAICNAGGLGPCSTSRNFDTTTWQIGPYLGYNFQIAPKWIGGVEANWNLGSKTNTQAGRPYPINFVNFQNTRESFAVKTAWDASLRARAGYLVTPATLVFATAGVAWMKAEATSVCDSSLAGSCQTNGVSPAINTSSKTMVGWTIGAGVETKIMGNWIARGEYRFTDYGKYSTTDVRPCSPTPSAICGTVFNFTDSYDIKVRTHALSLGLAYLFN